ncbi:putative dehydrogenase [Neorhizobium galegae]|uniref:Gfo/Idh/MocA family protein n=1 Tax=Neorhizobium galegae TaxID=399 RepID=UPI001AE5EB8D|nr:Gfo/Idh/MocA family oxidoreductase [Neorhizobium galegae]MBP2549778.1 putative dehydrogenase [Neorhizobium galegae]
MTPLRFIIVGLGARAQYWIKVLQANADCRIVGLIDPLEANRTRAADQCPDAVTGADLTLIDHLPADAVLLCTPPTGREAQIEACCRAGLPILAEKPLADSVPRARDYVAMAESAGVPLMVVLNFRYLPVTRQALRLFADEVGQPAFSRFTYERWRDGYLPHLNKYPLTMQHPMLWEQSIHHFDLMRFVYGAEPVSIYARTFNPPWSMYADDANVSAIITFANGVVTEYQGTWQGNWSVPGFEWRHDCAEGVVIQKDQFGSLGFARRAEGALTEVPLPAYRQWIDDASALLIRFVAALRGEGPLECSGRDHLHSLQMVEACIQSSRTGQAIQIADLMT